MVSALTTTGATTIFNIKILSEGLLLWRSLLQLLGGVGFIISCLYVFSDFLNPAVFEYSGYSKNLTLSRQLKIIVYLYFIFTLISLFMLIGSGISAIDAIQYSLGAISSGGILTSEINCAVTSSMILIILSILMFMSGISITFIKNLRSNGMGALRDQQFICYVSIIAVCTALFSIYAVLLADLSVWESIKIAVVTVISSVSTTGITIQFPESLSTTFTDAFVYVINFLGGCSGSCTGGIKIFRLIMAFLLIKSYLIRLIKTNIIYVPTYAGTKLDATHVTGLFSYFLCYLSFAIFMSLVLSVSELDFSKAFSAVLTSMNNNGPFFGLHRATVTEISDLSSFAKIILMTSMVAGRVEFIPFLMIFLRHFWKK
jgi:trk system potassium uptake protein TrkH